MSGSQEDRNWRCDTGHWQSWVVTMALIFWLFIDAIHIGDDKRLLYRLLRKWSTCWQTSGGIADSRSGRPRATPVRDGFTTSVGRPCTRLSDRDVRTAGSHYITPSMVNRPTYLSACETANFSVRMGLYSWATRALFDKEMVNVEIRSFLSMNIF